MITAAILVAGGPGTRLGAGIAKAFVELAGTPLVVHALRVLCSAESIARVVLVVPDAARSRASAALAQHGPWRCPVTVVAGGVQRQDSVRQGLAAIGDADLVAIHDAARPLVSRAVIEAVIAAAAAHGAAIAATPAIDTIKLVHADGWIESTPARQHLWLAQTPQVFRSALIRRAHAAPFDGDATATDDAMLVERLGEKVYVVPGNPENRKITTPEDLRWAEWLLTSPAAPR
ncbi:MAG: 2-C-methyl-D-erythritol 4-phosphate cytidylyltransferase [Candidatus Binatia bacterium]